MQEIAIIAAIAKNGVIGGDNKVPWNYPEDRRYFRQITTGNAVIMGRKTWSSLPYRFQPLPQRQNIIMTHRVGFTAPGASVVHSFQDAIAKVQPNMKKIFIIGGAEIYWIALSSGLVTKMYLTHVDEEVNGDVYFPDYNPDEWTEIQHNQRGPLTFSIYSK